MSFILIIYSLPFPLQPDIDTAIKQLLALKESYKNLIGKKPSAAPSTTTSSTTGSASNPAELYARVSAQGDTVRQLKSNKASKVRNRDFN